MQRLKARLSKSGNPFGKALFNILAKDQLSEADWEDVEDTLLLADVGAEASEQLVEELRNDARIAGQSDPAEVRAALKDKLLKLVGTEEEAIYREFSRTSLRRRGVGRHVPRLPIPTATDMRASGSRKLWVVLLSRLEYVMVNVDESF